MKTFLFPLVLLIGAGALVYLYGYPMYLKAETLREEKERYIEALAQADEIDALLDELEAQYVSFPEERREKLNVMLPGSRRAIEYFVNMSALAEEHDVSLVTIDETSESELSQRESAPLPYVAVPISMTFTAAYEDFLVFLRELEEGLRITDVTELALSTTEDDESGEALPEGVYSFNVDVLTYWLDE